MAFSFFLLFAFALPQTPSNSLRPDALALLNQVSQRYADAKSYHIEAIQEETSGNELQHSWQKTLLTAVVAPSGRYRYEGRSGYGAAVVVSDGATQWIYHLYEHLYTQHSAPIKYPTSGAIIPHEEESAMTAADIKDEMAGRAHRLKSATLLPDETIVVDGNSVECYVARYSDKDFKTRRSDLTENTTLWIEKSHLVVRKSLSRREAYMLTESSGRIPIREETTVVYPLVELDQAEPASSFHFVPPPDAKLVREFPNPFAGSQSETSELLGKPTPELRLPSLEGGRITLLSSFRGKPVFLEFWATWCTPCVDLIPELRKLYTETESKGLIWISVDDDEDADDAAKFMSREKLLWPNYHDTDGSLGKAFQREGIPLGVLIDAEGKVTFYKSGCEISDLRAAITKLGPQFNSIASGKTPSK
jgi:thiol-disulfide isomerase/thioredoxin